MLLRIFSKIPSKMLGRVEQLFLLKSDRFTSIKYNISIKWVSKKVKNLLPLKYKNMYFLIHIRAMSHSYSSQSLDLRSSLVSSTSRPKVFYEKDVFKKFVKFRGKHLCWGMKLYEKRDFSTGF